LGAEEVMGMEEMFFECSWWKRLWIVQEAVLARYAIIITTTLKFLFLSYAIIY
jgi:hypothetical protein